METENLLDFDELKVYFGEDYYPSDKIRITQPTIGDIMEFGDSKFYSIVTTLCGNPTMFRLQLWDSGVDWNEISDFDLFSVLIKNYTPKETYLLFGDLNLSWFEKFYDEERDCNLLINIPRDDNGNFLPMNPEDLIIIDEIIYIKIVEYLRYMFNIYPKVEKAKGKITKQAIIDEERMNLENELNKKKDNHIKKSFLYPLISSAVNHPGFKYKKNELREVGIVEFMDSVQRLQIYESTRALLSGSYSGMVDTSKMDKNEFNFMRDIHSK